MKRNNDTPHDRIAWLLIDPGGCALVHGRPRRVERYAPPPGQGFDLRRDGAAFGEQLRAAGLRPGRRVRVALGGGRVVLRRLTLPRPQDAALLGSMVDLAVEKLFAERREQLTLAWTARPAGPQSVDVGVAACPAELVEVLRTFCAAAGLTAVAAHGAEALLAAGCRRPTALLCPAGGGEALLLADNALVIERRELEAEPSPRRAGDLARAAAAFAASGARAPAELLSYAPAAAARNAAAALDVARTSCPLADAPVADDGAALAAALLAGLDAEWDLAAPPDLLHPSGRDDAAAVGRARRRRLGVAAAGLLAILAAAAGWLALHRNIAALQARADALDAELVQVKRSNDLLRASDPWFGQRTRSLDLLRDLSGRFPENGEIWLTSLGVKLPDEVSLAGRARRRQAVLDLLGDLGGDPAFEALEARYIRTLSGSRVGVSFAADCLYAGKGGAR